MPRPKRDYLAWTHRHVADYAQWMAQHVIDQGYPHATVESRLMEVGASGGSCPGPLIPDVMMPEMVRAVDHAVEQMPPDLKVVVTRHYFDGHSVTRHRLNEALLYLAGKLR